MQTLLTPRHHALSCAFRFSPWWLCATPAGWASKGTAPPDCLYSIVVCSGNVGLVRDMAGYQTMERGAPRTGWVLRVLIALHCTRRGAPSLPPLLGTPFLQQDARTAFLSSLWLLGGRISVERVHRTHDVFYSCCRRWRTMQRPWHAFVRGWTHD